MTYLKRGNAAVEEGKALLADHNYSKACQHFRYAIVMFEHHEWQYEPLKRVSINVSRRLLRQCIQMQDDELASAAS